MSDTPSSKHLPVQNPAFLVTPNNRLVHRTLRLLLRRSSESADLADPTTQNMMVPSAKIQAFLKSTTDFFLLSISLYGIFL